MFSTIIFRCDINQYSQKSIDEQYKVTQELINISEEYFQFENWLSMRSFAGDELIQTIYNEENYDSLQSCLKHIYKFLDECQGKQITLKSTLLYTSLKNDLFEEDFESEFKNLSLFCSNKEANYMRKNKRGELGKFVGIPLIASARLLEVSKLRKELIMGFMRNDGQEQLEQDQLNSLQGYRCKNIQLEDIRSLSDKTYKNLQNYMNNCNLEIWGVSRTEKQNIA